MSAALAAGNAEYRAMLDRFAGVAMDWRLSDGEVDDLLGLRAGGWRRVASAASPAGRDAETRMRRLIELDGLLRCVLGDAEACIGWLRRPNPGLVGRPAPLLVMMDRGTGLRQLRDALREEARACVPGWGL